MLGKGHQDHKAPESTKKGSFI